VTDLQVKDAVRKRDGFRCTGCGMTNDEHLEKYDRCLDVHRAIPGSWYVVDWCVTLCKKCHGKRPRTLEQVVFDNAACEVRGVTTVHLFHHLPKDRRIVNALEAEAARRGMPWADVLSEALERWCDNVTADYVI
jgi:hypothetical protein